MEKQSGSFSVPRPPRPSGEPSRPETVEWKFDPELVEHVVKKPSLGEMMLHDDIQDLKDAFVASMKEVVEALHGIEARLPEMDIKKIAKDTAIEIDRKIGERCE